MAVPYFPGRAIAITAIFGYSPYKTRHTEVSIEIPDDPLEKLNKHVGEDKKFVNQSDAIRTSIRKTLDMLDEIGRYHQRLDNK